MAMTRMELDSKVCSNPDCDHEADDALVLAPRCHPRSGVRVTYHIGDGILTIACKTCDTFVTAIEVAKSAGTGTIQ